MVPGYSRIWALLLQLDALLQTAFLATPRICDKPVFLPVKLFWTLPYLRSSKMPQHVFKAFQTPHRGTKSPSGALTPAPLPHCSSTGTFCSNQIKHSAVPERPPIDSSSSGAHPSSCWEVSLCWDSSLLPSCTPNWYSTPFSERLLRARVCSRSFPYIHHLTNTWDNSVKYMITDSILHMKKWRQREVEESVRGPAGSKGPQLLLSVLPPPYKASPASMV